MDPDDRGELKLASHWASVTPFVPNRRFGGTSGKHHLTPDKQILSELRARGFEDFIEEIDFGRWATVKVRLAPRSKTSLPNTPLARNAYRVRFKSRRPLCGPIVLGHSCHFGLGFFVPVADA
jgi:CRISPR-associated protein Csb2